MRFSDWIDCQDKRLWDWLELLLVPLLLGASVATLELLEDRRQELNLNEQYKQQILRDYFKDLNDLIFNEDAFSLLRESGSYDPRRELLGSRTVATLDILAEDRGRKIQVVRFIGNSQLSALIPIRRANLAELDLSFVNLRKADLRVTDMSGTNFEGADLRGSYLCGSDLSRSNFQGTKLEGAYYSEETTIPKGTLTRTQLDSMMRKSKESCGPPAYRG